MKKGFGLNTFRNEEGNVLFLILIAVALFAALSYAVTQSTRSGGGNANNESNLVNSAVLTQQPAGVHTAVLRMISRGTDASELLFNPSSDFGTAITSANEDEAVFHPDGGGASYQKAPADLMANGSQGTWIYSSDYEVVNVGTSEATDEGGNDIIAFLPGVTAAICRRINDQLGIGEVTPEAGVAIANVPDYDTHNMDTTNPGIGATEVDIITSTEFDGQQEGCFDSSGTTGTYTYYRVLIER